MDAIFYFEGSSYFNLDIQADGSELQVSTSLFYSLMPSFSYLGAFDSIACYKQEFGLSKTSHGLDDAVLDLLPKHLTLLRLLLNVDMLSGKPGLLCVQLLAVPLTAFLLALI